MKICTRFFLCFWSVYSLANVGDFIDLQKLTECLVCFGGEEEEIDLCNCSPLNLSMRLGKEVVFMLLDSGGQLVFPTLLYCFVSALFSQIKCSMWGYRVKSQVRGTRAASGRQPSWNRGPCHSGANIINIFQKEHFLWRGRKDLAVSGAHTGWLDRGSVGTGQKCKTIPWR